MRRTIAENMEFMETLKRSVGSIGAETLPASRDWAESEESVGIKLPASLKELINHFGHGTWGRDWVLFHPKAAGLQGLRQPNLLRVKPFVDPDFQSFMPGDTVAGWSVIPIGLLPYRLHIFLERKSEEIIV